MQIKEKKNLIDLMKRYSLIKKSDCDAANVFWNDVSEIRKWFCHNNDDSLYYSSIRKNRIEKYLDKTFTLATEKPKMIDCIQPKEWDILTYDIERRFGEYLDILQKGMAEWKNSEYIEELSNEWVIIFSKALFSDKELIQNVVADIARYEVINQGIQMKIPALARSYYSQIESGGYSEKNIEYILTEVMTSKISNREIIAESIRYSDLL